MTDPFSIVIICKDAAATIEHTLKSIEGMSTDVVVYDNGSTDGTLKLIQQFDVHLYTGAWLGFGPTRQKAVGFAKNDWILFVDADEEVTPALRQEILQQQPANEK
ncbi:MAG: glycosyltransferase, partial [Bacteroidota bacterium]